MKGMFGTVVTAVYTRTYSINNLNINGKVKAYLIKYKQKRGD